MSDMVNHPPHYTYGSGTECIEVIRVLPHALATAMKYVWRFRDKWNPTEDLKKAEFYINDYEKALFKNKQLDGLLHTVTTLGAKEMFDSTIRTSYRKHIVYLEKADREEAKFFDAVYQFLRAAQHGVVSYDKFQAVSKELENLQSVAEALSANDKVLAGVS